MTTNKPPIAAWAPSTALHKLERRNNNAPCVLTDGPAEFNDTALIRLSEYEALQAEYEKLRKDAESSESAFCAVIEYMLGRGRYEAPMDFLYYWSEGEFDLLRCHCPEAPAAIYYADPLADHDAIDAAMQEDNPC